MKERQSVCVADERGGERPLTGAALPRLAGQTLDNARRELRAWRMTRTGNGH